MATIKFIEWQIKNLKFNTSFVIQSRTMDESLEVVATIANMLFSTMSHSVARPQIISDMKSNLEYSIFSTGSEIINQDHNLQAMDALLAKLCITTESGTVALHKPGPEPEEVMVLDKNKLKKITLKFLSSLDVPIANKIDKAVRSTMEKMKAALPEAECDTQVLEMLTENKVKKFVVRKIFAKIPNCTEIAMAPNADLTVVEEVCRSASQEYLANFFKKLPTERSGYSHAELKRSRERSRSPTQPGPSDRI